MEREVTPCVEEHDTTFTPVLQNISSSSPLPLGPPCFVGIGILRLPLPDPIVYSVSITYFTGEWMVQDWKYSSRSIFNRLPSPNNLTSPSLFFPSPSVSLYAPKAKSIKLLCSPLFFCWRNSKVTVNFEWSSPSMKNPHPHCREKLQNCIKIPTWALPVTRSWGGCWCGPRGKTEQPNQENVGPRNSSSSSSPSLSTANKSGEKREERRATGPRSRGRLRHCRGLCRAARNSGSISSSKRPRSTSWLCSGRSSPWEQWPASSRDWREIKESSGVSLQKGVENGILIHRFFLICLFASFNAGNQEILVCSAGYDPVSSTSLMKEQDERWIEA